MPQIFQPTYSYFIAPVLHSYLLLTSDVTIVFMDERPRGILYRETAHKYFYFKIPYIE